MFKCSLLLTVLLLLDGFNGMVSGFAPVSTVNSARSTAFGLAARPSAYMSTGTQLKMSDKGGSGPGAGGERKRSKKRGVLVADKVETESKAEEKNEEQWRVVLHNDEVHTFNYVIQSLCKVIGTLDRKRAFDICVLTHGTGKATITKSWKAQAMKYCLGMQRQGLTASIAPESRFGGDDGPDAGGGSGDGGGGGDGGEE